MLHFTRALALIGLTCATGAVAAPRAESALECGIAADMAVVAHSLAKEDVQRTKADTIMARIYDVSQSDRGKELMKEILDAAYVSKGLLRHLHEVGRRHGSGAREKTLVGPEPESFTGRMREQPALHADHQ